MAHTHEDARLSEASVAADHSDVRCDAHRCDLETAGHLGHALVSLVRYAGLVEKLAAALALTIHLEQIVGKVSHTPAEAAGFAHTCHEADPAVLEMCLTLAVLLEAAQ